MVQAVRKLRVALALLTALTASSTASCASNSGASTQAQRTALARGSRGETLLESLAALPRGAERCTAVIPARVPERERAWAALVSQSEPFPWALELAVAAYARGEQEDESGRRAVVELLHFEQPGRAQIEAELARIFGQPVEWSEHGESGESCEGELTCMPIRGRFVDERTVLLERGHFREQPTVEDACVALLAHHPDAFEVGSRAVAASGSELTRSELLVRREPAGFVRESYKRYADPGSAERMLRAAMSGHDELPLFAGVTASSFGVRHGATIEQRTFISFEELALALSDRARLSSAQQAARALPVERVDAHDAEAVKASFDAQRTRLFQRTARSAPARDIALALDTLLTHARALSPADEGLLRRHFELQLEILGAPRAALATAEEAVRMHSGDERAWQLRIRGALARVDELRLRSELARAHGVSKETATRMARELAQRAGSGGDHERAEWAFLAAHQLADDAVRTRKAQLSLRVPLRDLGRLFAYLARSGEARGDVGIQVLSLAHAEPSAQRGAEPFEGDGPWRAHTNGGGRPGTIIAATSWDDAQLAALGRALEASSAPGPLELLVGIEQLGSTSRTTLALSGQYRDGDFAIESVSRPLAKLRWPLIERLLLEPLRGLTGATYPPDVLTIVARDADELLQLVRAAENEPRVRCTSEALALSCRGSLADQGAAQRALLQVVRALLESDGRVLWARSD